MSTQDTIVLNRKLFASALLNYAETWINLNGPNGYGEAVYGAFTKGGLSLGASPGGLRDWIAQQPGWRKRLETATKAFADRKNGIDPNHPELRRLERALQSSQHDLKAAREKLSAYDERQTVFEELAATLDDVIEPLDLAAPKLVTHDKSAHPVDFVVALSDQHADEVIEAPLTWGLERYNFDVFCLRLERWATLIVEYATTHLPRHYVERVHIASLGDALHGDIHDHKHRNHFGNTMRASVAVADAQSQAIAWILERVPYISLVGISGNHPRTTARKDFDDPHDNFDFAVLALMQARLAKYIEAGRLDVHAPRAWSAFLDVRGKVVALNHGDDVKGTWGIPWYGFAKKEARVQSLVARKDARADFFWYGHFHTDMAVTEAGSRGVHTGAFTMTDGYAQNALAAGGEPMQALMIMDDREGMRCRLADIPLWLRDEKAETAYWTSGKRGVFGKPDALLQLGASDDTANQGRFPLIRTRR